MNNDEFKALAISAIDKLEKQGRFSVDYKYPLQSCCYLSGNGDCCIIGHMMPDDETRKEADGFAETSIYSLWVDKFEWARQFTWEQVSVLTELQRIHDKYGTGNGDIKQAVKDMREYVEETL